MRKYQHLLVLATLATGFVIWAIRKPERLQGVQPTSTTSGKRLRPATGETQKHPTIDSHSDQSETHLRRGRLVDDLTNAMSSLFVEERRDRLLELGAKLPIDAIPEALASLGLLPQGSMRREFAQLLLSRWTQDDPNLAMTWIRQQTPSPARNEYWSAALTVLAHTNPEAAIQLANTEVGGEAGRRIVSSAYRDWAQVNGQAAIKHAREHLNGQPRALAVAEIVTEWSQQDPVEAVNWIQAHSNESNADELYLNALRSMGRDSPELVAGYVSTMPTGPLARQAATSLAVSWVKVDLTQAIKWARQLPDVDTRNATLASMMPSWIEQDPAGAAEQMQMAPLLDNQLSMLAHQWAATDFTAAVHWAETLSGPDHDDFVSAIATQRALDAPNEAVNLVTRLPLGPAHDEAMVNVATAWANTDPVAALGWIRRMSDESLRNRALRNVLPLWASTDPAQALQWAQTLPSGAVRDGVLSAILAMQPPRG